MVEVPASGADCYPGHRGVRGRAFVPDTDCGVIAVPDVMDNLHCVCVQGHQEQIQEIEKGFLRGEGKPDHPWVYPAYLCQPCFGGPVTQRTRGMQLRPMGWIFRWGTQEWEKHETGLHQTAGKLGTGKRCAEIVNITKMQKHFKTLRRNKHKTGP